MTKFKIIKPSALISFPDSGWTLVFQKHDDNINLSLRWDGNPAPTHEVEVDINDFKLMLKDCRID
jgi:hypothetical protein